MNVLNQWKLYDTNRSPCGFGYRLKRYRQTSRILPALNSLFATRHLPYVLVFLVCWTMWHTLLWNFIHAISKINRLRSCNTLVYQTAFSFVYIVVRNYGEELLYNLTLLEIILYQITTNAVENIAQNVRQNLLLMCMNSQHLNFALNAVDHRKHFLRNVYNVVLNVT